MMGCDHLNSQLKVCYSTLTLLSIKEPELKSDQIAAILDSMYCFHF